MQPREDSEFQERLRAAFEPDPGTVDRVVASALHAPSRRPVLLRAAAACAVLALVLLTALILLRQPAAVQAQSTRIEYFGGVGLLEFPDGSTWVVTPETNAGGPQHPNLIIVEGNKP